MSYVKVKDRNDLVRDSRTGCIINTSKSQYNEYLSNRDVREKETQSMKQDLDDLKNEMNEIKSLLKEILNG
tara:strand:- start:898 stop:1110 length:213 start_codon:yes stop_codon:yes gene_type:complete